MDNEASRLNNRYWDYISNITPAESDESIKDLFKNAFEFVTKYLDDIHYISANIIFMNYVCDVPQKNIGTIFGLSQYGVSKQVKSARRKIKYSIMKPEHDLIDVRKDISALIQSSLVETIVLYYQVKMFSVVAKLLGNITEGAIRSRILIAVNEINKIQLTEDKKDAEAILSRTLTDDEYIRLKNNAKRYYSYLVDIMSINNYSDFQFRLRVSKY